jgi:hypothetical protein
MLDKYQISVMVQQKTSGICLTSHMQVQGRLKTKQKKKGLENQKEEKTKSSQMITCNHVERF